MGKNGRRPPAELSGLTEWLSTEEAAEFSGYHVNYIRRLMRQKKVAGRRIGIIWWVDKHSLADYMDVVERLGTQKFRGTPTAEERVSE